jgi:hypothetical protein
MRKTFLLVFILLIIKTVYSQYATDFRTGMFTPGRWAPPQDEWFYYSTQINNNLSYLGINQIMKYTWHLDHEYECTDCQVEGGFNDSLSMYQPEVSALITNLSSLNNSNTQLLLEREKIVRPAYGQQSDYQAEMESPANNSPAYGWSNRAGTTYSETWQSEQVSGLTTGEPNQAGAWVLMNLYENMEQINVPGSGMNSNNHDHAYYLSDNKYPAPMQGWKWFVEPRMRISYLDATGPVKPVCRIVVRAYNGDSLQTLKVTLFTDNFRDKDGNYNGQYIDKFYEFNQLINFSITGDKLNQGNSPLTDGRSSDPGASLVDYRIYWYGEVRVWIDRVRVEDEWSYYLFNGEPPPPAPQLYSFKWKIQKEATDLTSVPFYFYQDEFQYNMIPCIAKVNELIREVKSQNGLVSLVNDWWWSEASGLKNPPPDFSDYVDKVRPPVLMVSAYPFDDYILLPPNINLPDKGDNPGTYWYANASTNDEYNADLQDMLDNGRFLNGSVYCNELTLPPMLGRIKKAASSVAGTNMPFQFNAPVHAYEEDWYGRNPTGCKPYVSRDQTVPEMRLMPYLALCYGAKQISYWWMPSFHVTKNGIQTQLNDWGLLERYENDAVTPAPRYTNYYGENKWVELRNQNEKLSALGNLLFPMVFQEGFSVHNEGSNHEYIDDIQSTYQLAPPNGPVYSDQTKYWEMGFFTSTDVNTKYFMMVNRRCVPASDWRWLGIKFDATALGTYRNWKLLDITTGQEITFDKFNQGPEGFVRPPEPMKTFQPGEGKLFKLVPVPISGGTLLADEVIPSGENFTCEDTVWTNGYNLTIEDGVTINFSDSAKFVVNGGTFQMGIAQHSGPNTINMDADNGSWKGFEFDTCNVKIYGVNFSGLANDSIAMLTFIDCPLIDIRSNLFTLGSNNNVWAVDINYSGSYGSSINDNVYIANNTFNNSNAVLPHVKVMAYSGITTPVIVEGNNFTGTSTALFLNNIQGGAIKSNSFTGFGSAITALSSSLDV